VDKADISILISLAALVVGAVLAVAAIIVAVLLSLH
jgi:hypothetical protein